MKIGFCLDDVIRAKTESLLRAYEKKNKSFKCEDIVIDTNNFKKLFGFKSNKEYQEFLYDDYAFEIFAEAKMTEKFVDKKLNLWHIDINEDDELEEEIDFIIVNPNEFNASIGFTYFFLSKMATRIRETFFPLDSNEIYNKCDVLVTADPLLLENKPKDKIIVKIETSYNKDYESDYTYESLSSFLDDKEIINKLIKEYKK